VCSYGQKASNWDAANSAATRAQDQAAANSWDANRWGARNDANQAFRDQLWQQGNNWHQVNNNGTVETFSQRCLFDNMREVVRVKLRW
jgi:hypothetical protein